MFPTGSAAAQEPIEPVLAPTVESELDQAAESSLIAAEVETALRHLHLDARRPASAVREPLEWDPNLTRLARRHAITMAWEIGDLVHRRTTVDARITRDWFSQLWRCALGPVGENLAWLASDQQQPEEVARDLFDQWMTSPSHRANVVNPANNRIGIGVAVGPDGRFWAVSYVADFTTATDCPESPVEIREVSRWATTAVTDGGRTTIVTTTHRLLMETQTAVPAEQLSLIARTANSARVSRAAVSVGTWVPTSNLRGGAWVIGDLAGGDAFLDLSVESSWSAQSDPVNTEVAAVGDWGATFAVTLTSATRSTRPSTGFAGAPLDSQFREAGGDDGHRVPGTRTINIPAGGQVTSALDRVTVFVLEDRIAPEIIAEESGMPVEHTRKATTQGARTDPPRVSKGTALAGPSSGAIRSFNP